MSIHKQAFELGKARRTCAIARRAIRHPDCTIAHLDEFSAGLRILLAGVCDIVDAPLSPEIGNRAVRMETVLRDTLTLISEA